MCVGVPDGASVGRVDGAPVGAADGWSVGAAVNFLRSAAVLELSLADLRSVSTQAMVYWPPGNTVSIVTGYLRRIRCHKVWSTRRIFRNVLVTS